MKKPRQFFPVLKQMLGFYRYGPLPLLIYLGTTAAVLLVFTLYLPNGWLEARAREKLWTDGLFVSCCASWFFLMLVATPLPFMLLGGASSLEFLFTRAINRGLWLRTERVAVIIIALGPLILNLALSSLTPDLALDYPMESKAEARYMRVFPGSYSNRALIVPHGNEAVAAWMVWAGAICIFLVAGYFSWVFTAWQRAGWHHSDSKMRPLLGAIMVNAPAYSPVLALILCSALRVNPLEESFFLFASHPALMTTALIALILIVQPLSERNIRKMEFEFF